MHHQVPEGLFNPLDRVNYDRKRHVPGTYKCSCGCTGVKLLREINSSQLHCVNCVNVHLERNDHQQIDINGTVPDTIHLGEAKFIAAIPTAQNDAFWAHKSAPDAAMNWWNRLPAVK